MKVLGEWKEPVDDENGVDECEHEDRMKGIGGYEV